MAGNHVDPGLDLVRLSKFVSRALRHEPRAHGLELDEAGWVPVSELLASVRSHDRRWRLVDQDDLARIIASSSKRRYEIDGGRIRALYGHSVPERIVREEAVPPDLLFHGTSPDAWVLIQTEGLRPMRRQYVHLSTESGMAEQVGRRRSRVPLVLRVHAGQASRDGVRFWRGNEAVWLVRAMPSRFIAAP